MTGRVLVSILCGVLFGAGIVVSDMVNPARVLAFLDVKRAWDPSLAFVMGGALVPSSIAYLIRRTWVEPMLDNEFQIPTNRTIDRKLVIGAILFGLGWGLVGLCPGPAIAALVTGRAEAFLFALALVAGMFAHKIASTRQNARVGVY